MQIWLECLSLHSTDLGALQPPPRSHDVDAKNRQMEKMPLFELEGVSLEHGEVPLEHEPTAPTPSLESRNQE